MASKIPTISIIIPTYNEEKNITCCIESIKKQEHPKSKIEIIIVDQKSDDKTQEIGRNFRCKVIERERPKFYTPPSISRNMGVEHSSGKYLFHMDADMILTNKQTFKKAIQMFAEDKNLGALIVHERDLTENYWAKCIALERKCYIKTEMEAARFVRRDIFKKVGGYDESISSGEDWAVDRMYRKVSKVKYSGLYLSHNVGKVYFWRQMYKKARYSKTGHIFYKKHHTSGFEIASKQLKYMLKNYKLLLKNPRITIGMIFLRFCEYGYGLYALFRHKNMTAIIEK